MNRRTCRAVWISLAFLVVSAAAPCFGMQAQAPAATTDDAKILDGFKHSVQQYLDTVRKPLPTGKTMQRKQSAESLSAKRQELVAELRAARPDAKQGDLFTPQVADVFRRLLATTFAGPDGPRIRASLQRAEPLAKMHLKVNDTYPHGIPLQSTPPSLLQNFPTLPKGVEYRIVDHTLILRDSEANTVVDYLPDAIPLK
jgi:hypothetical protein